MTLGQRQFLLNYGLTESYRSDPVWSVYLMPKEEADSWSSCPHVALSRRGYHPLRAQSASLSSGDVWVATLGRMGPGIVEGNQA